MILYSSVVDSFSLQCVSVERVLHITIIALDDEAVYEHVVALCRCKARRSRKPNCFILSIFKSWPRQCAWIYPWLVHVMLSAFGSTSIALL